MPSWTLIERAIPSRSTAASMPADDPSTVQVCPSNLKVQSRHNVGFVPGVEETLCLSTISRLEAFLLAGEIVVNVVTTPSFAAVESISLLHRCPHNEERMTARFRFVKVLWECSLGFPTCSARVAILLAFLLALPP